MSAIKHWDTNTRFYWIWENICGRTSINVDKNSRYYKEYVSRWITNERKTYLDFKQDMYDWYVEHCNKYWEKNTSIDRINNDWNYCKDNCRWATRSVQQTNRRFTWDNRFWINKKELAKKYWMTVHALQEFARRRWYNMELVIADLEKKFN